MSYINETYFLVDCSPVQKKISGINSGLTVNHLPNVSRAVLNGNRFETCMRHDFDKILFQQVLFYIDVTHNTGDHLRCVSNAFKVTSFDVNWKLCSPFILECDKKNFRVINIYN